MNLVWFRNDLRLADNPALAAAVATDEPVVPVFIWAPDEEHLWSPGAASRWWLHHSLNALSKDLAAIGSRLIVRKGSSLGTLERLVKETGATRVLWNRRYEPRVVERDGAIESVLTAKRITVESFNGALLNEPWTVKTSDGKPYQVFTPYWRACTSMPPPRRPLQAPRSMPAPNDWPTSEAIADLGLLPNISWDKGFYKEWNPGEAGAKKALASFLMRASKYETARDFPATNGTSRLSPHLHFGEISPREAWHAAERHSGFLREMGWREFAHHLLFHFPQTAERPLRPAFEKFPWKKDARALRAWQKGQTGFPIVDAGMRELWQTGWMHNRVRMIVASFLVKDLRISWLEGARWFWDTLVDADLANNTLGWQWSAGCGADAAPYFRVFNPTAQAEKFDSQEEYLDRWVPSRKTSEYPKPIVDHAVARADALVAFKTISSPSKSRTAAGKSKAPK